MRRRRLRTAQSILFISCGMLVVSFVFAHTLPSLRNSTRRSAGGDFNQSTAATPTASTLNAHPNVTPQRGGRRDLSNYDKAGPFEVNPALTKQAREAVMAEIRSFLLGHWRGHRKGHLIVHSPDAEGRSTASAFYVEPDASGRWSVTLETGAEAEVFTFVEETELPADGPPMLEPSGRQRSRIKGLHLKTSAEANSGLVL